MSNVWMTIVPVVILMTALAVWVVLSLKKQKSGIKVMLLGIAVILCGGIVAADSASDLGGFEYLIVLLGLILTVAGFSKKERE